MFHFIYHINGTHYGQWINDVRCFSEFSDNPLSPFSNTFNMSLLCPHLHCTNIFVSPNEMTQLQHNTKFLFTVGDFSLCIFFTQIMFLSRLKLSMFTLWILKFVFQLALIFRVSTFLHFYIRPEHFQNKRKSEQHMRQFRAELRIGKCDNITAALSKPDRSGVEWIIWWGA